VESIAAAGDPIGAVKKKKKATSPGHQRSLNRLFNLQVSSFPVRVPDPIRSSIQKKRKQATQISSDTIPDTDR
jgi:hypothetical protein